MADPNAFGYNNVLSDFATGYDPQGFVADIVSPIVLTDEKAGRYKQMSLKDILNVDVNDAIAVHGEANEVSYGTTEQPFITVDRSLKDIVPADQLEKYPLLSKEKVTKRIVNKLLRKREIRVADLLMNASNYGGNTTNGSDWTNITGTPLADIDAAQAAISIGEEASQTIMVLTLTLWQALRKHPDLRGAGADSRTLDEAAVAKLLGLDAIYVSRAVKDTANAGQAITKAPIWDGTKALIARVPTDEPTDETGLLSVTFRYRPFSDAGGVMVRDWATPEKGAGGSQTIQCSIGDAEVVSQSSAGFLLTGLTS